MTGKLIRVPRKKGGRYSSLNFEDAGILRMHSEGGEKSAIEMHDGRGAWEEFFSWQIGEKPCDIIRI
jgi:hypothetical protein